jgi:hypothetical protein
MLNYVNTRNGDELSRLGFGCMRLPQKGGGIDEQRAIAMIRDAIAKGVTYFDTAYVYHGGKSEVVLGKALEGEWRGKVKIATKLPPYMVRKLEGAQKIFATQLDRLKTDRIDYYLLHMLSDKAGLRRMADLGVMEWLEGLKAQGKIGNIGFSFHGVQKDFEELVRAYPWDFCQLQYNYMDEKNQAGTEGLLLAASLGIPVIVMEPLRGGKLVNGLPKDVEAIFASKKRSPAEWALRWVWNQKEVGVVLSGMSDEFQLADNLRIVDDAAVGSLSADDLTVFEQVKAILLARTKVPCTACGYCMPCPSGVDIPACFSAYNEKYLMGKGSAMRSYFMGTGTLAARGSYASRCIECGKCVSHCPQSIAIPEELKKVRKELEGWYFKPLIAIARMVMGVR